MRNPKIEIIWNHRVEEIIGSDNPKKLEAVRLVSTKDNRETMLTVDGVFVAIGHEPATLPFKGKLDMDKEGYIITTPDSTKTNIEGVFAAGDVKDKIYRQAVTAAGMGCMAALEAERYLAEGR